MIYPTFKSDPMKRMIGAILAFALLVAVFYAEAESSDGISVTVMIDFGDGRVYWENVTLKENRTALRATEIACNNLGFEFRYAWYEFGASVSQIGDKVMNFPKGVWWLWLWNSTAERWELSNLGWQVEVREGMVIGNSYSTNYPDWSTPEPLATPKTLFPWTVFRHDLYHTGSSESSAPESNDPLWIYNTNSREMPTSPVIADGKVYFNNRDAFYCLNEQGELLWKGSVESEFTPAIGDGKVFVGTTDGYLVCLDMRNGKELWRTQLDFNPEPTGISSPPAYFNTKVFVGTSNYTGGKGMLYSLSAYDGHILWQSEVESSIYFSSPAVVNGRVIIGLMGLYNADLSWSPPYGVYAFDENNGTELWNFSTQGSVGSSPLIHGNKVIFTSKDSYLYCLNVSTGSLIWRVEIGSSVSSPALYEEKIFVGSGELSGSGKFYSFDMDGNKLWEFVPNGAVQSSPAVADGKVFFATNVKNGSIYSLYTSNGTLLWRYTPVPENYIISSPSIADGKLFISSDNGKVYCFSGNIEPIANFSVSKFRWKVGEGVEFNASSSSEPHGELNYTWDFGDGTIGYGMIVKHSYEKQGTYKVTLTVRDDEGYVNSTTLSVYVEGGRRYIDIGAIVGIGIAAASILVIELLVIRKRRRNNE